MPTHLSPDIAQRALAADCGCGPTDTEKRSMWGPMSRRNAFGLAAVGVAGAAVLAAAGPGSTLPAFAVEYPSWDDVQKAKNDESAKAAEVTRIEGLIKQLQADVARTKEAAETAGQEYFEAQQAYELARARADLLQSQADEQEKTATEAAKKAGQVAAQLYRNGGDDTALQLFFSGSAASADEMLSKLGQMDRLLEHNKSVYESAVKARNSARSLSDQAKVQRTERDKLQKAAQDKFEKAQAAQQQAQDALTTQNANLDTLQAQLAALKDNTTKVVKDYEAGVEARRKAEEEARRKAEEEARRLAEEARKRAEEETYTNPDPTNPDPPVNPPTTTGTDGWVKPHYGGITSGYGPRYSECGPSYCMSSFHAGLDIAAGCGSAIYAAKSGTVTFAGYNGGYGNYIRIDHGGAYGTGYAHIVDGGILVGYGQYVNAGDLIGLEGNTGNSFGCHTHFEVYVWGDTVDPQPFLAERGIYY